MKSFSFTVYKTIYEKNLVNFFLLFLLAIITFYPLFSGGFTTHDDAYMALNEWNGITWEVTKGQSVGQGRFPFFWAFPLSSVPFIIDSRVWYLVFKFGSFLLLLCTLYYSIIKLVGSNWIALTATAIFLSILQNGWEHNAVTSYAFVFNFYAILFFASLSLLATAVDRNNINLAIISGIFYFFALGSELFVLFFPFYVVLVLARISPKESLRNRIKLSSKYLLAIALPLMVYLILYFSWRLIHPSNYEGNSLNGFGLIAAVKVIATYSLTAFPLASLHLYAAPGDPLSFAKSAGLGAIFSNLNVAHIIKPAIVGFLFMRLLTAADFATPKLKTLLCGTVLACVGIFLPNILLGFTARHQSWVGGGTYSYVYTYYSFISLVIFLAFVLAYANAKSKSWRSWIRRSFVSLIISVAMILGFAVEARNQHFAVDQKMAHRKWELMEAVIKSRSFLEIPDGSALVAPTLLSSTRGYAAVFADDWSSYVKYKTGKNIKFTDNKCSSDVSCFLLLFRQEQDSDNQFIILKKINKSDLPIFTELTIYSMPVKSKAVIIGSFTENIETPKLKLNGVPLVNVGAGLFSANFPLEPDGNLVQIASVEGNVDIAAERITISNYDVQPRLRSLSDELADGIDFKQANYPDFLAEVQGVSGYESWGRWTDATANPVAKFVFKQPLPKRFVLEITAGAFKSNMGAPVRVRVGDVVSSFVITPNTLEEPSHLEFETDGTIDTLEIIPPNPASPNEFDQKNKDTRKLGIGLISIKIKNVFH